MKSVGFSKSFGDDPDLSLGSVSRLTSCGGFATGSAKGRFLSARTGSNLDGLTLHTGLKSFGKTGSGKVLMTADLYSAWRSPQGRPVR